MNSQTFLLPWPISVNSLWRSYKGRNILSMKAREWARTAEKELAIQHPKPVKGPVALSVALCSPTNRAFDLDNRAKCAIDLLVRCGIIEADNNRIVQKITLELGSQVGASITVTPLAKPAPSLIGEAAA